MELPADCDAEAEGLLRPVLAARMAAASRYKWYGQSGDR